MASRPSQGLADVVAAATALSDIDGAAGRLSYRGYDIGQLAGSATFEEVAYLLQRGTAPDRGELAGFAAELAAGRALGALAQATVPALARDEPMAALRSLVSLGSSDDPDAAASDPAADQRKAARLTAQQPVLVAALHAARAGRPVPPPDPALGVAANLLLQLTGTAPAPRAAQILDATLVLHADHAMSGSTFAARVAAATLADMHSAVVAALATLTGPLHGGASERVMRELEAIRPAAGTDPVAAAAGHVTAALARGERITGFGYRGYAGPDPRAALLRELAAELAAAGDDTYYLMAARMTEVAAAQPGLHPSADFWAAPVYHYLGLPAELFTPMLSAARMAGWTAHVIEQHADNRLIRPGSEYVGERGLTWIQLAER
jgi:citrate synthase